MSWFSLLPDHLKVYEIWLVRLFVFLGVITIGPWLILLLYDLSSYCWRTVTYDVPFLGGRARGRQRPRAPSLTERPDGHKRSFSFSGPSQSYKADSIPAAISTARVSNQAVRKPT